MNQGQAKHDEKEKPRKREDSTGAQKLKPGEIKLPPRHAAGGIITPQ